MTEEARTFSLEDLQLAVAIEYPANVKNPEKAIKMVGGKQAIDRSVKDDNHNFVELKLRPHDRFHHPVAGRSSKHENILLKVTVPKRAYDRANGDLHKAIQLSDSKFRVRPSRLLQTNLKFREIADFQYNTANSAFCNKVRQTLYSGDLEKIKQFEPEPPQTIQSYQADIPPPPRFSSGMHPYTYSYRQNPNVAMVKDADGETKIVNVTAAQKIGLNNISWYDPVPTESPVNDRKVNEPVAKTIEQLKRLFAQRPIWTRSGLEANVQRESLRSFRMAMPHLAYCYNDGPFSQCYIKLGVDPKSSSEYAMYQAEQSRGFSRSVSTRGGQIKQETPAPFNEEEPYKFDGVRLPKARTLQLCDVTDPQITSQIQKASLKQEPSYETGWFNDKDYAIIKKLLSEKITRMRTGQPFTALHADDIIEGRKGNDRLAVQLHRKEKKKAKQNAREVYPSDNEDEDEDADYEGGDDVSDDDGEGEPESDENEEDEGDEEEDIGPAGEE